MSHHEYVNERRRRDPRFHGELDAAAAELVIGELLVNRWHERKLSLAELTDMTGIPGERLAAIEEGDSLTVHEVLWLLHALDLSIAFDQDFHVTSSSPRMLRRSVG